MGPPLADCGTFHTRVRLQLLEFVLAIPFAVGFKTSAVARALAATLAAEAVTCWPFWANWPTHTYAGHVR